MTQTEHKDPWYFLQPKYNPLYNVKFFYHGVAKEGLQYLVQQNMGDLKSKVRYLANMAEEERWTLHTEKNAIPFGILYSYIAQTFFRLVEEGKVLAYSHEKQIAIKKEAEVKANAEYEPTLLAWNTGLVTHLSQDIYCVMARKSFLTREEVRENTMYMRNIDVKHSNETNIRSFITKNCPTAQVKRVECYSIPNQTIGYAYVEMENEKSLDAAVQQLHNKQLGEKQVYTATAITETQRRNIPFSAYIDNIPSSVTTK
jgi:hypothetical protein